MANDLANRSVTYLVNDEEVKLSGSIVENYLKRGNSQLTTAEVGMFINLCKYQKLNPFLNEAYIVKFGSNANIIVGKEAFMKRAENHPQYDGFEAGLILAGADAVSEVEGSFYVKGDKVVGAYCRVYRKDRRVPIVSRVSFEEYSTGKSTWKEKPATMIRKVAIVQAMREAFPTDLGGMYTAEEVDIKPDKAEEVKVTIKENANAESLDFKENDVVDVPEEDVEEVQETEEGPGF